MSESKEWYLESGEELERRYPDTFFRPSEKRLSKVKNGDFVKLIFQFKKDVFDYSKLELPASERMWVKVQARQGDKLSGELSSEPFCLKTIKYGDIVEFEPRHIIAIHKQGLWSRLGL